MIELRFTETNSADDSAGKTWGLEGTLFWYLTGGVFISVIVLLVLFSMLHWTFTASLGAAAVPLILSLLYVFGFRQGKPAGHDRDLFELSLSGPGFVPQLPGKTIHPLDIPSHV
jgi:hypothetical protein